MLKHTQWGSPRLQGRKIKITKRHIPVKMIPSWKEVRELSVLSKMLKDMWKRFVSFTCSCRQKDRFVTVQLLKYSRLQAIWRKNKHIAPWTALFVAGNTATPICLVTQTCDDVYAHREATLQSNLEQHNIPPSDYHYWIETCIRLAILSHLLSVHIDGWSRYISLKWFEIAQLLSNLEEQMKTKPLWLVRVNGHDVSWAKTDVFSPFGRLNLQTPTVLCFLGASNLFVPKFWIRACS